MENNEAILPYAEIPAGVILAFAGEESQIPQGWFLCDGRLLKRNLFPKLFNAIGTVWGGSGTPDFYLPDLRGMFLRGVSGDSNSDPDKETRESPRTDLGSNPGNGGNSVGSIQKNEIQKHHHNAIGSIDRFNISGSNRTKDVEEGSDKYNSDPDLGSLKVNVTIEDFGGNETRPINANVYYIIKG